VSFTAVLGVLDWEDPMAPSLGSNISKHSTWQMILLWGMTRGLVAMVTLLLALLACLIAATNGTYPPHNQVIEKLNVINSVIKVNDERWQVSGCPCQSRGLRMFAWPHGLCLFACLLASPVASPLFFLLANFNTCNWFFSRCPTHPCMDFGKYQIYSTEFQCDRCRGDDPWLGCHGNPFACLACLPDCCYQWHLPST